jgi:hypothetical protein
MSFAFLSSCEAVILSAGLAIPAGRRAAPTNSFQVHDGFSTMRAVASGNMIRVPACADPKWVEE